MAHAEICPVCKGSGQTRVTQVVLTPDTVGSREQLVWGRCHGCDGRGWIEVSDQQVVMPWPHTATGAATDANYRKVTND